MSVPGRIRSRAFTLIELLVVIAIIAILAAILFPVFAQAKAAAKGSASLSNAKQSSLAMIMYGGDADDAYVPVGYRDATAPIGWDPNYIRTWAQLILPYMKTGDLLLDPLAAPDDYSWGPRDAVIAYYPQFGYNWVTLSPMQGLGAPRPLSQTALARPAETVLMTAKGTAWTEYGPAWDGGNSLDSSFTISPPYCDAGGWTSGINPVSWCNYVAPGGRGWGKVSGTTTTFEAGGQTGLVSMRRAGKAVVAYTDGHVAAVSDGRLAAGTDYNRNSVSGGVNMVAADKDKYVWDAD